MRRLPQHDQRLEAADLPIQLIQQRRRIVALAPPMMHASEPQPGTHRRRRIDDGKGPRPVRHRLQRHHQRAQLPQVVVGPLGLLEEPTRDAAIVEAHAHRSDHFRPILPRERPPIRVLLLLERRVCTKRMRDPHTRLPAAQLLVVVPLHIERHVRMVDLPHRPLLDLDVADLQPRPAL